MEERRKDIWRGERSTANDNYAGTGSVSHSASVPRDMIGGGWEKRASAEHGLCGEGLRVFYLNYFEKDFGFRMIYYLRTYTIIFLTLLQSFLDQITLYLRFCWYGEFLILCRNRDNL